MLFPARGDRPSQFSASTLILRQRTQRRLYHLLSFVAVFSMILSTLTSGLPAAPAAAAPPAEEPPASSASKDRQRPSNYGPPPGYVMPSPTPAPTVTPIPDTNYRDQEIDATRDRLLAELDRLPAARRAITATRVSAVTGGRVESADGKFKLGMPPGVVGGGDMLDVEVKRVSFAKSDPRHTRNGQPLAYTYQLTAARGGGRGPVEHFNREVTLAWTVDQQELAAAGVTGFPLKVYTFDETTKTWEEVPSMWHPESGQVVATTPHFSDYAIGAGFDKVNNYLPTVNGFEVDLQSGTATMNYPINVPAGPGGFGPQVSLSYNSGNIDRVDASQQGTSAVGWGWSLSTSYIAARQHTFDTFHPWTASIVLNGTSGDLVKGTDGNWHTEQESFTRIQYDTAGDFWQAWDRNGTKYVFNLRTQVQDQFNTSPWVTNRWMLASATDVSGNVIYYDYKYQNRYNDQELQTSPIIGDETRAVYPWQIRYGAGGDKLRVTFNIVGRAFGGYDDISDSDRDSHLYQSHRIDKIVVERLQQSTGTPQLLRAYELSQDHRIILSVDRNRDGIVDESYRHLTLNAITPRGYDGLTQLPTTSFRYWQPGDSNFNELDNGHIWWAYNGYGGEVGFYYDAAGGDAHKSLRRVRAKRIGNGLGTAAPHRVTYYYEQRGARLNDIHISGDAAHPKPLHDARSEFRGFGWVRVQDPSGQVSDHFFSQDDAAKAKEWRVQQGKATSFGDGMDAAPGASWLATGTVSTTIDLEQTGSNVWKVPAGSSIQRTAGMFDGSDIEVRFKIKNNLYPSEPDGNRYFIGVWKLENANGNGDFWGLRLERAPEGTEFRLYPKLIWSIGGAAGSRDLSPHSYQPRLGGELRVDAWHRLKLHTSPDGRFAIQLMRDDGYRSGYIQLKSGDGPVGGQIPHMPTGATWRFKHEVTQDEGKFTSLLDQYSETRTLYSQSDQVYAEGPAVTPAAANFNEWRAGYDNNADGMKIRFVPLVESSNSSYGAECCEPGRVKRSKQTFEYGDGYGNQTAIYDYGDLEIAADDRSTHTVYANNAARWIIGKPGRGRVYRTITADAAGTNLLAQSENYYDEQPSPGFIPDTGRGLLTEARQVGILNGLFSGQISSKKFHYDAWGNQDQVSDPRGNSITTTYDGYYRSFPISVSYPNGRSETTAWDFRVDAPSQTTDMNGTLTEHRYDVFGRPSHSWIATNSLGSNDYPNERYIFADLGDDSVAPPFFISLQKRVGTADGQFAWQTRWFDGVGRAIEDVSPKDATTSIVTHSTYDVLGRPKTTSLPYTAANSNSQAYITPDITKPAILRNYDGAGRVIGVQNPDNTRIGYDYNWLQCVGTWDEVDDRKYECYDMQGRLDYTQEEDWTAYSSDPHFLWTDYSYDALDRLTGVVRDSNGPNQTSVSIGYDDLGRKSSMSDPDMGNWQYFYDLAGNLTEQRDALYLSNNTAYAEHQVFFSYDNMNRIKAKYYGLSHYNAGVADVKYHYDNDLLDAATKYSWGRLRHAEVTLQGQGSDKANGHGYEYDVRGLVVADVVTTTHSTRTYRVGYAYDKGGRPTTVSYPNAGTAEQVTVGYNAQAIGLPNSVTSDVAGNPLPVESASYNERGQLLSIGQGNPGNLNYLTTSYSYDEASTKRGWLTRTQVTSNGGTSVHLDLNLSYFADGNIATVAQNAGGTNNISFTNSYGYDGFDRLRQASSTQPGHFPTETYSFDSLSRMTTRVIAGVSHSYTYGDPAHKDAPTAYRGNSYSYDAVGNQVSATGQTRTFDAENRLVRIVQGTTTSEFVYDANGKRVLKSVTTSGVTKRTLYMGNLYEEELTGTSTPPYINYYSLGGKLVGMRRTNQPTMNGQYRLVSDHLGSASLMVDTSGPPQVVQRQYFKAYGEVAFSWSAGGSLTDIGYTGQRAEGTTGLMFYGARFYDPQLSYFTSADTIGVEKGASQRRNRYAYVLNNPLRFNDPTGHKPADPDEAEKRQRYLEEFDSLGIRLEGAWELWELEIVLEAIRDLMRVDNWTPEDFKRAMGGSLRLVRMDKPSGLSGFMQPSNIPAQQYNNLLAGNTIEFFDEAFNDPRASIKNTVVHELAHAWDSACDYCLSRRMMVEMGGSNGILQGKYDYGDSPPPRLYGVEGGPLEDFAEAVAATVYPTLYNNDPRWPVTYDDWKPRRDYVMARFASVRTGRGNFAK